MQDRSIDGALLALRKNIIRDKLDGLEHVEALLWLRSVPMPEVRTRRRPCAARCGHMRAFILEALRDGPKPRKEIVRYVAGKRPDIPPEVTYKRVDQSLWKAKLAGLVAREGRLWRSTRLYEERTPPTT